MILDFDDITASSAPDILAALPDAIGLAMGAHAVRNPHPFAALLAESPLRGAAYAAGIIASPRRGDEPMAATIGFGLRTPQFGRAIAASVEAEARRRFDAQARHRSAVTQVEVTRLAQPETVPALDLDAPFAKVNEGGEFGTSVAKLRDGETIELASYGRLIEISRHQIFNDDLGLISEAVAATGRDAARLEARLVSAAVEANPTMADGGAVFHADYGNVSAAAFDAAGLAAAMAALRAQPAADGEALDAQAVNLIVGADLEYSALNLVHQAGLQLAVFVLPGMAAGRYYVCADREIAQNIAVARLAGQTHALAVEPVKAPIAFDGLVVRCRVDSGSAMTGRVGIVRGGA